MDVGAGEGQHWGRQDSQGPFACVMLEQMTTACWLEGGAGEGHQAELAGSVGEAWQKLEGTWRWQQHHRLQSEEHCSLCALKSVNIKSHTCR